ncbi:MAG: rod shape-determining protein RodA [Bacteroidota bacterium]
MRNNNSITGRIDWILVILLISLVLMGIATLYSAAFNQNYPNIFDVSQLYGKQLIWIGISLFFGFIVYLIDSDIYKKFAIPIYGVILFLLVIVLFMPAVNGARAWLGIGSLGIQPAEFAKIATALVLAKFISESNLKVQNNRVVLLAFSIILIPMILILLQPDAGTFVVFTSFLFVLYREGITFDPIILNITNSFPGVKFKQTWVGTHFIPISLIIIVLAIITILLSRLAVSFVFLPSFEISGFIFITVVLSVIGFIGFFVVQQYSSKRDRSNLTSAIILGYILSLTITFTVHFGFSSLASHQKERIEFFLGMREDPDGEDYNRNRAMAAVGSGGINGKGYKNASVSSVRANHVPESETDFIFCPFAEEWGFLGSLILISIYTAVLIRIVFIAERQRSVFNRVYAYCVVMIIFYHVAINIGMNIGFAPVIGIPLPFFSYGGSSILSFTIMMFILLKLDSQRMDVLR